LSLKEDALWW